MAIELLGTPGWLREHIPSHLTAPQLGDAPESISRMMVYGWIKEEPALIEGIQLEGPGRPTSTPKS